MMQQTLPVWEIVGKSHSFCISNIGLIAKLSLLPILIILINNTLPTIVFYHVINILAIALIAIPIHRMIIINEIQNSIVSPFKFRKQLSLLILLGCLIAPIILPIYFVTFEMMHEYTDDFVYIYGIFVITTCIVRIAFSFPYLASKSNKEINFVTFGNSLIVLKEIMFDSIAKTKGQSLRIIGIVLFVNWPAIILIYISIIIASLNADKIESFDNMSVFTLALFLVITTVLTATAISFSYLSAEESEKLN